MMVCGLTGTLILIDLCERLRGSLRLRDAVEELMAVCVDVVAFGVRRHP